jgi:hypothetical protein
MPRRWLYRLEQSFNFSGQRGGAYCEPEGPQDSVVLPVSVSRRQPVRSMKLCGPLQEFKSMGRRLDPGNRGGVAEANAVNVDINITPRSLRLGRALRHSSTHAAYFVSGPQPWRGGAGWPVSFSRFGAAGISESGQAEKLGRSTSTQRSNEKEGVRASLRKEALVTEQPPHPFVVDGHQHALSRIRARACPSSALQDGRIRKHPTSAGRGQRRSKSPLIQPTLHAEPLSGGTDRICCSPNPLPRHPRVAPCFVSFRSGRLPVGHRERR